MKRGAFTLVEVLLASTISVVTVGTMAVVYNFAMTRTSHAFATGSTVSQMQTFSREVDKVISEATSATVVTVSGRPALKCTMPASPADSNGDGTNDTYLPISVLGGSPRWGSGKRIWFYMASSSGVPGTAGSYIWRAERNDDLVPIAANTVRDFTYVPGSTIQRFGLLDTITWVTNPTDKTVSYTLAANSLTRSDSKSATAYTTDSAKAQVVQLARTVFTYNWRQ